MSRDRFLLLTPQGNYWIMYYKYVGRRVVSLDKHEQTPYNLKSRNAMYMFIYGARVIIYDVRYTTGGHFQALDPNHVSSLHFEQTHKAPHTQNVLCPAGHSFAQHSSHTPPRTLLKPRWPPISVEEFSTNRISGNPFRPHLSNHSSGEKAASKGSGMKCVQRNTPTPITAAPPNHDQNRKSCLQNTRALFIWIRKQD